MLLSVLIPTYNRTKYLKELVMHLSRFIETEAYADTIEVHVFNNASTDDTVEVLKDLTAAGYKFGITNHISHVGTAEENVFQSFRFCRGRYVWVLGDDDVPVIENMSYLISILRQDKYDFLQFNNSIFNDKVTFTASHALESSAEIFETDIVEFARYTGIWFSLAEMSGQIVRRELIENYDLTPLIRRRAVIYSHVIAYLEVFKNRSFAFINRPLVHYKVTFVDKEHWDKAAKRLGFLKEHIWSVGAVEQFNFLSERGVIGRDFVFSMFDLNDFFRFRFIYVIINKLITQIDLGRQNKDQLLPRKDVDLVCVFLQEQSPIFTDLTAMIRSLYDLSVAAKNKESRKVYEANRLTLSQAISNLENDHFFGLLVQRVNQQSIFKVGAYYLVASGKPSEKMLRALPGESGSSVFRTHAEALEFAKQSEPQAGVGVLNQQTLNEVFTVTEVAQLKKLSQIYLKLKLRVKRFLSFLPGRS